MKLTLLKKQILLSSVITLIFVFLGLIAAFIVIQFERDRMWHSPFLPFAHLLDNRIIQKGIAPEEALDDILEQSPLDPEHFALSIKTAAELQEKHPRQKLPEKPYDVILLDKGMYAPPEGEIIRLAAKPDLFLFVQPHFLGPPDHPPGPWGFKPPPFPHPPGMEAGPPGEPPAPPPGGFFPHPDGHPGMPFPPPMFASRFFLLNFAALIVSVVLGSALSLFLFFGQMRGKAALAEKVLSEMQSGNLKARFPVKKLDETGQVMVKFNKMADEIEHLVEQLKTTESARTRLLQDLAHDLRTPIASLKNFTETLDQRDDLLSKSDRKKLLGLSLKEIEYFEHLVEDLLFLAQVKDPRYRPESESVDVLELLRTEADGIAIKYQTDRKIELSLDWSMQTVPIHGDPRLLRRLFRNALENSYSFARSQIKLSIVQELDHVTITLSDDGPGLSDDMIASFGEKRSSRIFDLQQSGRVSVGLGSVIMKTVMLAHNGSLQISNRMRGGDKIGANLVLKFKNWPTLMLL